MKVSLHQLVSIFAMSLLSTATLASYPDKPIKLVVPYAAGGPTDTFARALSDEWGKKLGTTMIVENKAGAGTMLGTENVARAPKDGYTVLMATVAHSVNPSLHAKLSYDPVKDFAAVGLAARAPLVLIVNNDLPVKTLPEFFDYLRNNPGKSDYGSAGVGSAPHLGGALLDHLGKFDVKHIPYRGSAPALADLIGGHVQFMVDSAPTGLAQAQAGAVRLLATSMAERLPQTPDVPAIAEQLPGYEAYTWNAMLVPAGTPPQVIEKLRASLEAALNDAELQKKAYTMGLLLEQHPDPAALDAFIAAETKKWNPVVTSSNMAAN